MNVMHNPVIFPKMTAFAMGQLPSLIVDDYRMASNKLNEYLIKQAVGRDIPDIAYYDLKLKRWNEYYVDVEDTVKLRLSNNRKAVYYPLLMREDKVNMVISFLLCNSDAKLRISEEIGTALNVVRVFG